MDLGAYTNSQGFTSYSAGYTSGVAGVVAALLPQGHTPQQVINVIDQTVTPHAQSVGAWSKTGGVINPAGAVALAEEAQFAASSGIAIDCGGGSAGNYSADAYYTGGSTYSVTDPIDTGNVTDPAPQQVYQSERYGNFTYTLPFLVPDSPYIVRLDFAEIYWNAPNERLFNVLINDNPVLTNFDIFAAGGRQGHCHFAAVRVPLQQLRADRDPVLLDHRQRQGQRHRGDTRAGSGTRQAGLCLERGKLEHLARSGHRRQQLDPLVERAVDAEQQHRLDLRGPGRSV